MRANRLTIGEIEDLKAEAALLAGGRGDGGENASFLQRLEENPASIHEWATELALGPGDIVFREGEKAEASYLVVKGLVALIGAEPQGPRLRGLRGPGEVVGETVLVDASPRDATAAALGAARFLRISRESFHRLLRTNPEFGLELTRILSGAYAGEMSRAGSGPSPNESSSPTTSLLIEREEALATIKRFLGQLGEKGCSILKVSGEAGSGHSSFLREVASQARMMNHHVIELAASEALSPEAIRSLASAALPASFLEGRKSCADEKGSGRALVLILDDAERLKAGCIHELRKTLAASFAFPLGFVYACGSGGGLEIGNWGWREDIVLKPFTDRGVRSWLRYYLRWEAPAGLAGMLSRRTGGLPTALQRELATMLDSGELRLGPEGWVLGPALLGRADS